MSAGGPANDGYGVLYCCAGIAGVYIPVENLMPSLAVVASLSFSPSATRYHG